MKFSNTIIINEKLLPSNKKAFTLAEVLITLSILGIVAALTVPALINRQSDMAAIVKLKKAISTFDQAANVYMVENETSDITGMVNSCAAVKQYFKTIKDNNAGEDEGCIFTTGDGALWEFLPSGIAIVRDSDKKPRFTVFMWAAGGDTNMGINNEENNSGDSYFPDGYRYFSFEDTSGSKITSVHDWYYLAPNFLKLGSNDIINGVEGFYIEWLEPEIIH